MKILWFTNTPSLAEIKLSKKPLGGGWIKSLEREISKISVVELGVAFYSPKPMGVFMDSKTKYYPIVKSSKRHLFDNLAKRISASIESEDEIIKFLEIIRDFKPDLIHIHGSEGPFGLIQRVITDIPIVLSIQGNLTVYQEKYYSGISKYQISRYSSWKSKLLFKTWNSNFERFSKAALREREILSLTKNVIGRTDWDRRITEILSPGRSYFHNDEILRESFYARTNHIRHGENRIFTTTTENIYKGLETILKACVHLDNLNYDYTWHVGGIERDSKLISLIETSLSLTVSQNLIFLGKLDEKDLSNQILKCQLYVMTSHIENSPNSLCEAMLLGVPCIASNAGGTSSLLKDKEEGILIQDGDSFVLAGAILEMFGDRKKMEYYAKRAKKRAEMRHDPKRICEELLNIYEKIIDSNK